MVKLFVGNLPPSASNQSLKEIFQPYKDLQDFKLISNYGFVYLETEESAIHAVNNLNGLEYRGFTLAVDFARENNKLKRKADLISDNRSMGKSFVGAAAGSVVPPMPGQPVAPAGSQQRNTNPYNLPFLPSNGSNMNNGVHGNHHPISSASNTSINRSFEALVERRYGYNNGLEGARPPTQAPGTQAGLLRLPEERAPFPIGGGGGYYGDDQDDYYEPAPHPPPPSLLPPYPGMPPRGAYGPHDSLLGPARPPLAKRFRSESFVEDDLYDFRYNCGGPRDMGAGGRYGQDLGAMGPPGRDFGPVPGEREFGYRAGEYDYPMMRPAGRDFGSVPIERDFGYRSGEFEHPMMRTPAMSMLKRPNWYETNHHKINHQFLSSERDQRMFVPRRGHRRQMKKSYIDEYEDNNDYSETDPYPAYLKQYQK